MTVNSAQSQTFAVGVGLCRGCPLSLILFVIFMEMITRCSLGKESVRFGNHRVVSTPMTRFGWLWPRQGRFAAKCEAVQMRVTIAKSEALVFYWKTVVVEGLDHCPEWRRLIILGSCSREIGGWSVRWTGGLVWRQQFCRGRTVPLWFVTKRMRLRTQVD